MATREELEAQLDKLRNIRAQGTRKIEYANGSVEYRSDAELAAAIADLERRIAGSSTPLRVSYLSGSKGL